jgi:hypothetical protein
MAQRDEINTPLIVLVGFLATVLTFAIVVLLMVVYYHAAESQEYAKVISQPWVEVGDLVAKQQAKLGEYRWVDQKQKIVAIPIDRAMQLVVNDLSPAPERNQSGKPVAGEAKPAGGKNQPRGALK